jgi:hypothetical protein
VRTLADGALYLLVQLPLLVLWLPAAAFTRAVSEGYWRISVVRRRLRGAPLLQEHDRLIGRGRSAG